MQFPFVNQYLARWKDRRFTWICSHTAQIRFPLEFCSLQCQSGLILFASGTNTRGQQQQPKHECGGSNKSRTEVDPGNRVVGELGWSQITEGLWVTGDDGRIALFFLPLLGGLSPFALIGFDWMTALKAPSGRGLAHRPAYLRGMGSNWPNPPTLSSYFLDPLMFSSITYWPSWASAWFTPSWCNLPTPGSSVDFAPSSPPSPP